MGSVIQMPRCKGLSHDEARELCHLRLAYWVTGGGWAPKYQARFEALLRKDSTPTSLMVLERVLSQ